MPEFFSGFGFEAGESGPVSGEDDDLFLSAEIHDGRRGMSVAEAVTFPKFLSGPFIPTDNAGVFTKGSDDDNITDDKDALGVAPFRGVGIGVSFFERNFPVGLVGLTVDTEDLSEWSDEVDGVLFHSRDTPGAGYEKRNISLYCYFIVQL